MSVSASRPSLASSLDVAACPSSAPSLDAAPRSVFIIDDDPEMASCLALAVQKAGLRLAPQIFPDALAAAAALDAGLPCLILLDILLTGPDGFTFLNELASYPDTARIPIVIVSSLQLPADLAHYGVVATLQKDTMTPADVQSAVRQALAQPSSPADAAQPSSSTSVAQPSSSADAAPALAVEPPDA